MKKRQHLMRMLFGKPRLSPAKLGEASDLDADYGVRSLSLSGVLGGFSPARLRVGGAPLAGAVPTFDAPIELPSTGEHAVDRIGRGFFKYYGENVNVLSYDASGLSSASEGILTLALGAPFSGSVTLSVGGESMTREISGVLGDSFDFVIPKEVLTYGTISFRASGNGTFRLSLHGKEEVGEGLALTVLATNEDSSSLSSTRISLPTPLYLLPSGEENALELSRRTLRAEVASRVITIGTPIGVQSGTENSAAPVFLLSPFGDGRGDGTALSTHGIVGIDDSDVTSGRREGFSLLSEARDKLAMTVKYQRLTSGVRSVEGVRLDSFSAGSPDSPARYDFYPYGGGYPHYFGGNAAEKLSLRLAEPLRRVGEIFDSILIFPEQSLALRITRIAKLTLSGRENFQFQPSGGGVRFYYAFRGGQMSNASNTVTQLCTHADISATIAQHAPAETDGMTAYLGASGLYIALSRDYSYAESRSKFLAYLSAEAARGEPFTYYYPLAEPQIELISLSALTGNPSGGDAELSPLEVTRRDDATLCGLLRLWLARQSILPRLLYRLPSPEILPIREIDGQLLLPDGRVTLSTVGRHKPLSLALAALTYPEGKGTSSAHAAGSEG